MPRWGVSLREVKFTPWDTSAYNNVYIKLTLFQMEFGISCKLASATLHVCCPFCVLALSILSAGNASFPGSTPHPPSCHYMHTTSVYLRGRVSGGPVVIRQVDGVGDAAVIFSRRLVALRVRPPRRVAFLNGARLLEPPAAQQISHLKIMQELLLSSSLRKSTT